MKTGARSCKIPADALDDKRLKPLDQRVLMELGKHHEENHGWRIWGQGELADVLGASRERVSKALNLLERCGYVEVMRRAGQTEAGRIVNSYRVRFDLTAEQIAAAKFATKADADFNRIAPKGVKKAEYDTCDATVTCDPMPSHVTPPAHVTGEESSSDDKSHVTAVSPAGACCLQTKWLRFSCRMHCLGHCGAW